MVFVKKRRRNSKVLSYAAICFLFLAVFLRPIPMMIIKPKPNNSIVAGSGTGMEFATIEALKSKILSFTSAMSLRILPNTSTSRTISAGIRAELTGERAPRQTHA